MAKFLETFPVALENIKDGSQFIFQKDKVTFSEMDKPRKEFQIIGMRRDTLNDVHFFHDLALIYIFKGLNLEIKKTQELHEEKSIFNVLLGKDSFECVIKRLV